MDPGKQRDLPQMLILWISLAIRRAGRSEGVISSKPSALSNGSDPSQTPSAVPYDGNNLVSPIWSSSWNQCGIYTLLSQLFPIIFPHPLRQRFPPEVGGEILWERKQGSYSWSPLFLPTSLFLKEHFSSPGIFILLIRRIKISQDLT